MPIDRAKLIKLLGMTTSQNDGEALNAIRMVNAMLKVNKLDWDSAIAGSKPQPIHKPPPRPQGRGTTDTAPKYKPPSSRYTDPEIPRMLQSLMRDSQGDFRDFVQSLNEFWENKGFLTEGQYEEITNTNERAK